MRAVTCSDTRLQVVEVPDPVPGRGQLLLKVLRCGICGSDLHARHHLNELADITAQVGYNGIARPSDSVIFGHEFCGEVLESSAGWRAGTPVVAFPLLRRDGVVHPTGFSVDAPGGYAERVVVEKSLAFAVPNGLPAHIAALTEPMAVGLHAVNRSQIGKGQAAIVIGCGPVGLAVIAMLKARGVRTVIASDFSPGRRALAAECGADVVVDPDAESPYAAAAGRGHLETAADVFDLALDAMGRLRRIPFDGWHRVYRTAQAVGVTEPKHPVVFECVGVPGIIDNVITAAPLYSRVVVVGVCMQPDRIRPALAINKEIDLRFVLGYTPLEFRDALHLLADGKVRVDPIVTATVGLGEVDAAFGALADPERHAKILIDPAETAAALS